MLIWSSRILLMEEERKRVSEICSRRDDCWQ